MPALAFVFLGFALAVYGVQHYTHKDVKWRITGTLKPDKPVANLQGTRLTVFPIDVDATIDPATGRFNFERLIPEGTAFGDFVAKMHSRCRVRRWRGRAFCGHAIAQEQRCTQRARQCDGYDEGLRSAVDRDAGQLRRLRNETHVVRRPVAVRVCDRCARTISRSSTPESRTTFRMRRFSGTNNQPIGSTDASGRIRIDLPPGAYTAQIAVGATRKQVQFTIDNGAQLKRIEAQ